MRTADLFYDRNGNPTDTAATGLASLIRRTTPRNLWTLERFDAVAWETWPHRGHSFARACVTYHDLVSRPFPEAMLMWVIIRDGFLFDWLGQEQWMVRRDTFAADMHRTYRASRKEEG
jgi:hypothetical protein